MAAERKPRSADYKLGYQSGRNARDRAKWETEQRHQAEVLAVAERAERAEKAAGIGHCEDCAHWKRTSPAHMWGICMATKAPGTPHGCWAQAMNPTTFQQVQISTAPRFGCVLFLPKHGNAGVWACSRGCPHPDTCKAVKGEGGACAAGKDLPDGGKR